MSLHSKIASLKIAERLIILNDRTLGILARIYNIKKSNGETKMKLQLMNDKKMEAAIKHIVKKFPVVETRLNMPTFEHLATMKSEVIKALSPYYYTFADLLDLKDNIMLLLTTIESSQCCLNITLSYDLTAGYLDLVANLTTLMVMLSRIEDRKTVLGLFNAAYDLQHSQSEACFPRIGQMILDYENPLKKLSEDFAPLHWSIHSAISSLAPVYLRRNITAEKWGESLMFTFTAYPQQILYAAQNETIACEYLSLNVMDKWIVFCGTLCHSSLLKDSNILKMWKLALQMGTCLGLYRDEVFVTHQEINQFLDSGRGAAKKIREVNDCNQIAIKQATEVHAARCTYLRSSMRELVLLFKDEPGLLGPKVLFVWIALCAARDEVVWLLNHQSEWSTLTKKGSKTADEHMDRQLPELLHYISELRDLVEKYTRVVRNYHQKFITSYDSIVIKEMVPTLNGLNREEKALLVDFVESLENITLETDLKGLRLDWFRMQAWSSVSCNKFSLKQNVQFAIIMNTTIFHLKMVDMQNQMLQETSDLSIFCFHQRLVERHWSKCLQSPSQCRFALSYARVASHYTSTLHEMCPEEKSYITDKALGQCNKVIDDTCQKMCEIIQNLADNEIKLSEQLSPGMAALRIVVKKLQPHGEGNSDQVAVTLSDNVQSTFSELCVAFSGPKQIAVAGHLFSPETYLTEAIELKLVEMIHARFWEGQPHASNPRRPSEMLSALQAYLTVLQNVGAAISLDITSLIQSVLLQQTQAVDSRSNDTITSFYTKWFLEVLLRQASAGPMIWSEHLKEMLTVSSEALSFVPEHYSDPVELRALAQIIGPYGIKFMTDRFIQHVASQTTEMYKIVERYKDELQEARSNFDNVNKMKEILGLLSMETKEKKGTAQMTCAADALLQRTVIIGQICAFRDSIFDALKQIVEMKLPLLKTTFDLLNDQMDDMAKPKIGELSAAMGVKGPVDMAFVRAMKSNSSDKNPEEQYNDSCLLFVAIAICLPRVGMSNSSTYKPAIKASLNNSHCIPLAIDTIGPALFHSHKKQDIQERMKEFLTLACSGTLRTNYEKDGNGKSEEGMKARAILYIILEQMVRKNQWLSMDMLETCFPYDLVRNAYQQCYEEDN